MLRRFFIATLILGCVLAGTVHRVGSKDFFEPISIAHWEGNRLATLFFIVAVASAIMGSRLFWRASEGVTSICFGVTAGMMALLAVTNPWCDIHGAALFLAMSAGFFPLLYHAIRERSLTSVAIFTACVGSSIWGLSGLGAAEKIWFACFTIGAIHLCRELTPIERRRIS